MTTEFDRSWFARELFARLWAEYRAQVPYAREYEAMVNELGARFVNDHVAFRTLRVTSAALGIESIAPVFRDLGYQAQAPIDFADAKLHALPFSPPDLDLPKVFISELIVENLPEPARGCLTDFAREARELTADIEGTLDPEDPNEAIRLLLDHFLDLPWGSAGSAETVNLVNQQTQYGAWVMLFGNRVNHFTAYVNAHGVERLDSIDKVAACLRERGVPMKDEIEGEPGSRLRQTATHAASVSVPVVGGVLTWPYAYFELAERGEDPDHPGELFQGFLGPQARQLFEMTRVSGSSSPH